LDDALTKHRSIAARKIAATATLSSRYQISIPKAVRDQQGWKAGQAFALVVEGKSVLLVPVPTLEELTGIAKGANTEGYRGRKDRY
jgi:AbrB family looped-hinge helix DNA binding protein